MFYHSVIHGLGFFVGFMISNGNRTEWSAIQGVIGRVI